MPTPVPCATSECGCKWGEALSGLDKQCQGLGAAPGGHISAEECEAFCCHHSTFGTGGHFTPDDGRPSGFCDLWQYMSVSDLPDATYKWTCFVGVSGTEYACGKNSPALAHVSWLGARHCLGTAPARLAMGRRVIIMQAALFIIGIIHEKVC
jgi:hypothetical protein